MKPSSKPALEGPAAKGAAAKPNKLVKPKRHIIDLIEVYGANMKKDRNYAFESLKTFVERHREDINYCDDDGKTALMHARERGYHDVMNLLLKNGAFVESIDAYGKYMIILAAKGTQDVVLLTKIHHKRTPVTIYRDEREAACNAGPKRDITRTHISHTVYEKPVERSREDVMRALRINRGRLPCVYYIGSLAAAHSFVIETITDESEEEEEKKVDMQVVLPVLPRILPVGEKEENKNTAAAAAVTTAAQGVAADSYVTPVKQTEKEKDEEGKEHGGETPPGSGSPGSGSGETPGVSGSGETPPGSGSGETPGVSGSGETPPGSAESINKRFSCEILENVYKSNDVFIYDHSSARNNGSLTVETEESPEPDTTSKGEGRQLVSPDRRAKESDDDDDRGPLGKDEEVESEQLSGSDDSDNRGNTSLSSSLSLSRTGGSQAAGNKNRKRTTRLSANFNSVATLKEAIKETNETHQLWMKEQQALDESLKRHESSGNVIARAREMMTKKREVENIKEQWMNKAKRVGELQGGQALQVPENIQQRSQLVRENSVKTQQWLEKDKKISDIISFFEKLNPNSPMASGGRSAGSSTKYKGFGGGGGVEGIHKSMMNTPKALRTSSFAIKPTTPKPEEEQEGGRRGGGGGDEQVVGASAVVLGEGDNDNYDDLNIDRLVSSSSPSAKDALNRTDEEEEEDMGSVAVDKGSVAVDKGSVAVDKGSVAPSDSTYTGATPT